jgi:hypothetical protein
VNSFNIADTSNQRIYDFVHQTSNLRLRSGTGAYSTPFRGTLFSLSNTGEVGQQLMTRQVDALLLGTNPCVPQSLDHVLNPPGGSGHFADFEHQMKSGSFGALKWDQHGNSSADWNPIQKPTGTWAVYRNVLGGVYDLDAVTMANFIPWGSQNADALLKGIGLVDPSLLKEMLAFADELNVEIVRALRPKLLVVPFSLGRNERLAPRGLSMKSARDIRPHHLPTTEGRVTFYTGVCARGGSSVPAVYVRHPSSLQLSVESRRRLVDKMVRVLADFGRSIAD